MSTVLINGERVEFTPAELAEQGLTIPEAPPAPERTLTWLEFMDLFTTDEQVELAGAAMTDPNMKLWYDRALGAQGIYLSDPRTVVGLDYAVSQGLISQERRDAALAGEKPNV